MLAGALFAAVGIAFWWQGNGLDQYLFGAIFSFAGVVVILCAVGVLLSSSELNIDGKRWRLKSGWYGFRGAGREFSADNIKDIGLKKSMFSSSGNNLKQRNCVTARLTDGTKLKLVRGLSNRRTERRLIFELQQLAGLPLVNKDVDAAEEQDGSISLANGSHRRLWTFRNGKHQPNAPGKLHPLATSCARHVMIGNLWLDPV